MLIRHACAYIDGQFLPDMDILVRNKKIAAVGRNLGAQDDQVIDIQGDYLLPGFVDVHTHGFGGYDVMQGEEAIRKMCREMKKSGTAAFLATTECASPEHTAGVIAGIDAVMKRPEEDGAYVLGAHMEGPFMNTEKCGALKKEYFVHPSAQQLDRYTGGLVGAVRLISLAPEMPGAREFIPYARSRGIRVSIGHTMADGDLVHAAADWGADHITHTFNAQTALHHRKPGVPGAALVDDRFYCEVICDGAHVHPDVVRVIARCKGASRFAAITDALCVTGLPAGEYFASGHKVILRSDAAYLEDGTLCGSRLTMAQAFRNLIAWGIEPEDAARMTTCTPAKSIGAEDFGVIREGACGMLVRFDSEFSFVQTLG